MNRVLSIEQLGIEAAKHGLTYRPDPTERKEKMLPAIMFFPAVTLLLIKEQYLMSCF